MFFSNFRGVGTGRRRARARGVAVCVLAAVFCLPSFSFAQLAQGGGARSQSPAVPPGPRRPRPVAEGGLRRPAPPVITVVHRLSGWRLRALLTPPDAQVSAAFDDGLVSTNIVAGYVLPDGRTVVARLPHAEVLAADGLLAGFAAQARGDAAATPGAGGANRPGLDPNGSLTLVRHDGRQFAARFVGLDAGTGLSLLEADAPLLVSPRAAITPVAIGGRVCVYAPLPTEVETTEVVARPATPPRPDAPTGDEGTVLYMNLTGTDGTLRDIRRAPTGTAMTYSVEIDRLSPEWAGGVALDGRLGALVGIVERSAGREARLIPAQLVVAAAERIRARRASVPQPWLGARGDAVAMTPADLFVSRGWPREQASELVRRRQGVVLTAVAPDTPAARAGLLPGDVIERVGSYYVRGVEDMTWMLRELGGNRAAEFTVLRAGNAPMTFSVMLSEAQSPAFQTAQSELLGAQAALFRSRAEIEQLEQEAARVREELRLIEQRRSPSSAGGPPAAELARESELLRARLRRTEEELRRASTGVDLRGKFFEEAEIRFRDATAAHPGLSINPLLSYGLRVAAFNSVEVQNGTTTTTKGLKVMSLPPGSAAERAGLRVGDLIETVNGEPALTPGWKSRLTPDAAAELTLGVLRGGQRLTLKLGRAEP